jgi:hypothetical protein
LLVACCGFEESGGEPYVQSRPMASLPPTVTGYCSPMVRVESPAPPNVDGSYRSFW